MPSPTKQPPNYKSILRNGESTISMAVMWLTTTIVVALVHSKAWIDPGPPEFNEEGKEITSVLPFFVMFPSFVVWFFAMLFWVLSLHNISPVLLHKSLMGGVVVATVALMYVILRIPGPTFTTFATYTFWPMHVGLMFGVVV